MRPRTAGGDSHRERIPLGDIIDGNPVLAHDRVGRVLGVHVAAGRVTHQVVHHEDITDDIFQARLSAASQGERNHSQTGLADADHALAAVAHVIRDSFRRPGLGPGAAVRIHIVQRS